MWFTKRELRLILQKKKTLTIRKLSKKGSPPYKVGNHYLLKTGSRFSKERYGVIVLTGGRIKPLKDLTLKDALMGGYGSREKYIRDQLLLYNKGVGLNDFMCFYTFELVKVNYALLSKL